jgi:hypothetical protein
VDFIFDSFSRQHERWLANITVAKGNEQSTELRDRRRDDISSGHLTKRDEIYLSLSRSDRGHMTHGLGIR